MITQMISKYIQVKQIQMYTVLFLLAYITQIIQVSQRVTLQMTTEQIIQILLEKSFDGASYYAGVITSNIIWGTYPLQQINQTKIGIIINKYVPNGLFGQLAVQTVIILQFYVNHSCSMAENFYILKFFLSKLWFYFTTAVLIALIETGKSQTSIKFIDNLNQCGHESVLAAEITVQLIQVQMRGTKIGPDSATVVMMSTYGLVAEIYFILLFINSIWSQFKKLFQ
ncbi:Hypothetical_protein [Hexamita inflata]|uniref:Hypothetical_protein n=1 Tax=Hexamita inflata TaxID=28002 RepID=A0AA86UBY4_9EUKA|nr:Hypothetical protein HINF_LOCUS39465 [Hexamita inflata]